jgi:hypothetical protein
MNDLELIKKQFRMAQDWTIKLVGDLDAPFWKLTPPGLNTNINWQVGHITVGLYYQALVCVGGEREVIKNVIPLKELINAYKMGTDPTYNLQAKPDKESLLKALRIVYRQVDVTLNTLEPADLDQPTEVQHPVAGNKREVLSWCSHHQMWHNGTISIIKRILVGNSF